MHGLVAIFLVCWCSASVAKPLVVDSGEHADFSRIVIPFGEVPEWRFGRVAGGYELRPDLAGAEYDLSGVFDFIPKTRIAAIEVRRAGRIFLAVECRCHADAFEIRNWLVIDIKDGAATKRARFEGELPGLPSAAETTAEIRPVSGAADLLPETEAGLKAVPTALPLQIEHKPALISWEDPLSVALMPAPDADTASDTKDRVAATQSELIAQIGRASAQGMIETDFDGADILTEALSHDRPDGHTETRTPVSKPESEVEFPGGTTHLHIETAVDRGQPNGPPRPAITQDGATCLTSESLDLARWGDPPDHGAALGRYRSGMIGEFDQADPDGIAKMARNYIYLTFGAEARSLIAAFRGDLPDVEWYQTLAEIMDHNFASDPGAFANQLGCDTRAALWAVMARPRLTRGDRIAKDAVMTAFAELPLHLRRHIGPGLARRFLEIGDSDAATAIRNTIARAPGDHGASFDFMTAEIDLNAGYSEDGAERLAEIVRQNGTMAPRALIRLIDEELDAARPISDQLIGNADALAFENRGTPLGAELARVHLRAVAHSGQVIAALAGVEASKRRLELPEAAALALRREILSVATEKSDATIFLKVALSGRLALGEDDAARQLRRRIAARLLLLGLPEPARDVMSEDDGVPTPEDRRIYAESFVAEGRADLAIGYLAGLKDLAALELLARAQETARDFDRATETYASLGDAEAQARSAWRARNWAAFGALGTGAKQAAAELWLEAEALGTASQDPADERGPLARDRQLLDRSRTSRDILAEMLNRTQRP